jgi:hypothetical protein
MLERVCYWIMADALLKYDIGPAASFTREADSCLRGQQPQTGQPRSVR